MANERWWPFCSDLDPQMGAMPTLKVWIPEHFGRKRYIVMRMWTRNH